MNIKFDKYQGAGNDFIIIDNRKGHYSSLSRIELNRLCNRNTGIGADGVILVEDSAEADFEMRYFNSDGNPSSLCGNGGRCSVAFANRYNIIGEHTCFKAIDGLHLAQLLTPSEVRLKMQKVNFFTKYGDAIIIDTGSPHYVKIVKNISEVNVKTEGAAIRYSDEFKSKGINVNFVQKKSGHSFLIRTYERGVEDETLACGTGAVAGALVMHYLGETKGNTKIELQTLGGILKVDFETNNNTYQNIHLEGPANFVFSGTIEL